MTQKQLRGNHRGADSSVRCVETLASGGRGMRGDRPCSLEKPLATDGHGSIAFLSVLIMLKIFAFCKEFRATRLWRTASHSPVGQAVSPAECSQTGATGTPTAFGPNVSVISVASVCPVWLFCFSLCLRGSVVNTLLVTALPRRVYLCSPVSCEAVSAGSCLRLIPRWPQNPWRAPLA